jgi:hypothetical protein
MSDAAHSPLAPSARDDIAFMRALAQEGARGPILGGSILLAIGLIYAAASLAVWYVLAHMPSQIGQWTWPIWGSAFTAHAVAIAVIVLRRPESQAATAANRSNRVFAMVWTGIGFAIMACLASFSLTAWLAHMPAVFAGFPAVILTLYGVGWTVTATASNERWTWTVAILSFLFAVAAGALAGNVNLPLLFAAALLLLLALPGALLIKRASVRS